MKVQVNYEGESFYLQCGSGMQRVAWIARVASTRLGSGGIWCAPEHEVSRPKEFIPGKVFSFPKEEELDQEATIVSLLETEMADAEELAFKVEMHDTPAHGLPSLAAKGSEDAVVPPKNSKAAVSYQVTRGKSGRIVTRTPAPLPDAHQGHTLEDLMESLKIEDITKDCDVMIIAGLRNVLSNNFAPLVDIFLHYASPKQEGGVENPEKNELAINMKAFAKFVRTCRLSSEACSFFEIQRASVRPSLLLPAGDEEWSLGIYEADYGLFDFFEALVRIAYIKNYGLSALCDQLNKLVNTQILPYATGDDEDKVRDLTQRTSVQMIFYHQRNALRKFFTKKMKLDNSSGARTISLSDFITCLKASNQIEEELTTTVYALPRIRHAYFKSPIFSFTVFLPSIPLCFLRTRFRLRADSCVRVWMSKREIFYSDVHVGGRARARVLMSVCVHKSCCASHFSSAQPIIVPSLAQLAHPFARMPPLLAPLSIM